MASERASTVPAAIEREVETLRREIVDHNQRYYELDAPEISDAEYDGLFRRLQELEAAYPAVRRARAATVPARRGWCAGWP